MGVPARPDLFVPRPKERILVQEVFGELLIYDQERNMVRRLNRAAAAIWKRCDGQKDVAEIARGGAQAEGQAGKEIVLLALHQFSKVHLLAGPPPESGKAAKISRRELIRRVGLAALPLVTSMAVPTPAQAASCLMVGMECSSNSQCCSGLCLPNVLGIGICT